MKHQIALVGGQLLPIYLGFKEFTPDKVHYIVSKDSKKGLKHLMSVIKGVPTVEHNCNAYDFDSVKTTCEKILDKIEDQDEVSINFTGGTKIMVLAIHSVLMERGLTGFYINQDNTLLSLPSYSKRPIECRITTDEFLRISGHQQYTSKTLNDFIEQDFKTAREIEIFANTGNKYTTIANHFRKKYIFDNVPLSGEEQVPNDVRCKWDQSKLEIFVKEKLIQTFRSSKICDLFFNAGWWELIVAQAIAKWDKLDEILLKFELTATSDQVSAKNEIDILINSNNKLIFVECKSGTIKQEDINKMKIIKQSYGGLVSKSILVSRFMPNPIIVEKCRELDIEIFFVYAFKGQPGNSFQKLVAKLTELDKKNSLN